MLTLSLSFLFLSFFLGKKNKKLDEQDTLYVEISGDIGFFFKFFLMNFNQTRFFW